MVQSKYLVGIRTNKFDTQSRFLYKYYKSYGIDVVFVYDETLVQTNTSEYIKLSLNIDFLKNNKLYAGVDKVGWLCGDYCLYLMMIECPDYEGYWLIEDDAFIRYEDLRTFFEKPIALGVDFLIGRLNRAHKHWKFINACKQYFGISEVFIALFSIVYISKECCQKAFLERIKYVQYYSLNGCNQLFLNDEAFMVNAGFMKNYNVTTLNHLYSDISYDCYNFSSISVITKISQDFNNINNGLYHPIVFRNFNIIDYYRRLKKIANKRNSYKKELFKELIYCLTICRRK